MVFTKEAAAEGALDPAGVFNGLEIVLMLLDFAASFTLAAVPFVSEQAFLHRTAPSS